MKLHLRGFKKQLLDLTDGYSESLRVIDPTAATVLRENLNGVTAKATERYSNWYVNLQAQKQKVKAANAADLQYNNIIQGAILPGSNDVTIKQQIAKSVELLGGLSLSEKQLEAFKIKAYNAAIKENYIFNFNSSPVEEQEIILKRMETVPAPGMSLLETQGLRKSLQSDLNQKLSALRSASKGVVADIAIQTKLLTDGGMPSSTSITNLETQIEDLGPDAGDARVALADLKFNIANAEIFRGQSFEELSRTVAQLRNGIDWKRATGSGYSYRGFHTKIC